jgi:hypothetical protein
MAHRRRMGARPLRCSRFPLKKAEQATDSAAVECPAAAHHFVGSHFFATFNAAK